MRFIRGLALINFNFVKQSLIDVLCCPQCKDNLELVSDDRLKCVFCLQEYQIKNEIPILTIQGAW